MSLSAAVIRELVAAGLSGDALVDACARIEAASAPVRTARQDRNARYYEARKERLKASEMRLKTSYPSPLDGPPCPFPQTPYPDPPLNPPSLPPSGPQACAEPPVLGGPGKPDTPPGRIRDGFDDFWLAYPKRDGANPKEPARKKFHAAARSGDDPDAIVAGARSYAAELAKQGKVGTVYVAQAVTWLNQRRWQDYAPQPTPTATPPPNPTPMIGPPVKRLPTREELLAKWTPALIASRPDEADELH